jgi:formamidopyrimidine-DNA glycosylase
MPELPEVEILVRHLNRLLPGRTVQAVSVFRPKIVRPTSVAKLRRNLVGARFRRVSRRGKYIIFHLKRASQATLQVTRESDSTASPRGADTGLRPGSEIPLVSHLGMTGRMYLLKSSQPLPKHAAVVLGLGRHRFVFEDTRYFGRFTLDSAPLADLGAEPLSPQFSAAMLAAALRSSGQPIKVKLLDQTALAGVGNIYASEALHLARISPKQPARSLTSGQVRRLHSAIRQVLQQAIDGGSTVPLDFAGQGARDGLFYYGSDHTAEPVSTERAASTAGLYARQDYYEERLRVYDRAGARCPRGSRCGGRIERIVQAGRSTYFCPRCQVLC